MGRVFMAVGLLVCRLPRIVVGNVIEKPGGFGESLFDGDVESGDFRGQVLGVPPPTLFRVVFMCIILRFNAFTKIASIRRIANSARDFLSAKRRETSVSL